MALNSLGEAYLSAGQPEVANAQHAAALGLASQVGNKQEQARAHNGLGLAYHASGEQDQACQHWDQALSIFTDLGAPEADQVRGRLANENKA